MRRLDFQYCKRSYTLHRLSLFRLAEPQGKELVVLQLLLEDLVGLLVSKLPVA